MKLGIRRTTTDTLRTEAAAATPHAPSQSQRLFALLCALATALAVFFSLACNSNDYGDLENSEETMETSKNQSYDYIRTLKTYLPSEIQNLSDTDLHTWLQQGNIVISRHDEGYECNVNRAPINTENYIAELTTKYGNPDSYEDDLRTLHIFEISATDHISLEVSIPKAGCGDMITIDYFNR